MTEETADGPADADVTQSASAEQGDDDAYNGVLGAFPYAIRASDSRLFRAYGVLGGLLALLVAFMFTLSLVGVVASTTGAGGGVFTFSRAFIIFVGMLVVFPLMAPILSVARRHRRTGSSTRYDAAMGLGGFLFILSLYLALLLSVPPEQQEPLSGATAPLVQLFYDLPALTGLVPPTLVTALLYLAHRRL